MKENGKKGRLAKENYLGRLEIRLIEGVVECNLKLIESKEREERLGWKRKRKRRIESNE